jgi:predicted nucleic acid-binding Zn ribbon protein
MPVPLADPLRARQRRGDPQPLEFAINGLVRETGWAVAITAGSVAARWAEIVGPDLAGHTVPDGLRDGELTVSADSTAWATQLRLLAGELVRKLNAELGAGTVTRVRVLGPAGSPRRSGEWRVRGGRGPRDTYG